MVRATVNYDMTVVSAVATKPDILTLASTTASLSTVTTATLQQSNSSSSQSQNSSLTSLSQASSKTSICGPFYVPSPHLSTMANFLATPGVASIPTLQPEATPTLLPSPSYVFNIVDSSVSICMTMGNSAAFASHWRRQVHQIPLATPSASLKSQSPSILTPTLPSHLHLALARGAPMEGLGARVAAPTMQSLSQPSPLQSFQSPFQPLERIEPVAPMYDSALFAAPPTLLQNTAVVNISRFNAAADLQFTSMVPSPTQVVLVIVSAQPSKLPLAPPAALLAQPALSAPQAITTLPASLALPSKSGLFAPPVRPTLSASIPALPSAAENKVNRIERMPSAEGLAASGDFSAIASASTSASTGASASTNVSASASAGAIVSANASSSTASQTNAVFQSTGLVQWAQPESIQLAAEAPTVSVSTKYNVGQDPYRLSDGFIVLISIAILFVCALLFYFYMRRRKRFREILASTGRSLHSSKSSMPSLLPGNETKYLENNATNREIPDSGTSVNFKPNMSIFSRRHAQNLAINTMTVHSSQTSDPQEKLQNIDISDVQDQDADVDEVLNKRYFNYRDPTLVAATQSKANREQNLVALAKHTRLADTPDKAYVDCKRVAGVISYGSVSPVRTKLLASPLQKSVEFRRHTRRISIHANAFDELDADIGHAQSTDLMSNVDLDFSINRSLLDTLSANPNMNVAKPSPASLRVKPRKLVREVTKKTNPVGQSAAAQDKLQAMGQPATIKALPSKDPDAEAVAHQHEIKQSKTSNSLLLRTMFRSMASTPKESTSPAETAATVQTAELTTLRASKTKAAKREKDRSADIISQSFPDIDGLAGNDQGQDHAHGHEQGRMSPLLDSIESISESYQFTIRHKPPLGPLRAVEPHNPALSDELIVERGHHLFVIGEFADGWVLAVNISRNSECGMIPRRCLFFPTASFMTKEAIEASNKSLAFESVPAGAINQKAQSGQGP
ncbi:hypothetical protein LPJ66_002345 [Kickxella alabastrina]|uniref:Uncharacterized protein n=1 Tax=Kickxella alabastrina TaxID=61397 RepID=A0ACC1IQR4_9FUNG|nr:hypothetical protein LPJ66_002345 [Kickxella alabastrina]